MQDPPESVVPDDSMPQFDHDLCMFEEIDSSLSELEMFEKLTASKMPLQRLVYIKLIGEAARDAGLESTLNRICPIIGSIAADKEMVIRQALATQLADLCTFLCTKDNASEDGLNAVLTIVLPALKRLVQDASHEVRDESVTALTSVAKSMESDKIKQYLIVIIKELCGSESDDLRSSADVLFNRCALSFGGDECRELCRMELMKLSQDTSFRVRKTTAHNLSNIIAATGSEFTVQHILPIYQRLSKDVIWSVRKGCVQSLVPMSTSVSKVEQAEIIIPMLKRFIKDRSRWVKNEAYEVLGKFLFSLESNLISFDLLRIFTSIPSLSINAVDSDVSFFSAFSFPAVISRLGRGRWDELSPMYFALCKDTKFKVRRTLSFSLHLVANTLGTEMTDASLLPIFEMFLKDLDEVRVGIITHITDTFAVMSQNSRVKYLGTLWQIQRDSDQNWRFRLLLAKQLIQLTNLFPPDILVTSIVPLALTLSRDRIADVRKAAASSFGSILKTLRNNLPNAYHELLKELMQFANSTVFQERQLFILFMSASIYSDCVDIFESEFIEYLSHFSTDCVVNVRITLAHFLRDRLMRHSSLKRNTHVRSALHKLRFDECNDVSAIFDMCTGELNLILQDFTPDSPDESLADNPSSSNTPTSKALAYDATAETHSLHSQQDSFEAFAVVAPPLVTDDDDDDDDDDGDDDEDEHEASVMSVGGEDDDAESFTSDAIDVVAADKKHSSEQHDMCEDNDVELDAHQHVDEGLDDQDYDEARSKSESSQSMIIAAAVNVSSDNTATDKMMKS